MGKPIAGRDKFPFGPTGIVVAGAKLADGTVKTGLRISKQCSVIRFDLLDPSDSSLFSKLLISTKDANGIELDKSKTDAELASLLAPGTFFVRAVNSASVQEGLVIRFQLNKVIVSDGTAVYDMDYSKGTDGIIRVQSIAFLNKTATVKVGSTVEDSSAVTPTNATNLGRTFTTSNAAVATVAPKAGAGNIAVITGVSVGTATITVTTADGAKTDTVTVTVTAAS